MKKLPLQARPQIPARRATGLAKTLTESLDVNVKNDELDVNVTNETLDVVLTNALDSTTGAIDIIDYPHHEIHGGSHYFIQGFVQLAINAVFDMILVTPDTGKWPHFLEDLDVESETEWYLYEGATIITAGTQVLPINNNRNSPNVSGVLASTIQNASLALANADTSVAAATLLASGIVGSGKNSQGGVSREDEIVLKQNTIYCLRAVANAAGYVNFHTIWYEHTNRSS